MRIAIAGGHSHKAAGASEFIDEVTEDRKVKDALIKELQKRGHETVDCTNEMPTVATELNEEVRIANASKATMFVAIHFNAAAPIEGAYGSEVCYKGAGVKNLAAAISKKLSALMKIPDRGAKYRTNLKVLNATKMPSILPEICFVDARKDVQGYLAAGPAAVASVIADCLEANAASWVKDTTGWWRKFFDGSWPKNRWMKLDAWYYFDAKGYAVCNAWKKLKGKWYFFDSNCRMKTGWVKWKNNWYWLKADGDMAENETLVIDGKEYSFDKDGKLK